MQKIYEINDPGKIPVKILKANHVCSRECPRERGKKMSLVMYVYMKP